MHLNLDNNMHWDVKRSRTKGSRITNIYPLVLRIMNVTRERHNPQFQRKKLSGTFTFEWASMAFLWGIRHKFQKKYRWVSLFCAATVNAMADIM